MAYIKNIKQLQARAGLSNVELAQEARVSPATIQHMRANISVTSRIAYRVQTALETILRGQGRDDLVEVANDEEEEEPALSLSVHKAS